jgi:hypothetical protein
VDDTWRSCIYGVGRMILNFQIFWFIVSTSSVNSGGLFVDRSFSLDRRRSPLALHRILGTKLNHTLWRAPRESSIYATIEEQRKSLATNPLVTLKLYNQYFSPSTLVVHHSYCGRVM